MDPSAQQAFQSILFPSGFEQARSETLEEPACFADLNLDQIAAAIISKRSENDLRPFLFSTYRSEEIVGYRQEVFRELEHSDLFALIQKFCDGMRKIRIELSYAEKIHYKCHRQMVVLDAIQLYCKTVRYFCEKLSPFGLQSRGFQNLRCYLNEYIASAPFAALAAETEEMQLKLSTIRYGMLVHGGAVTVRKYASEADYSEMVLDLFARFRNPAAEQPEAKTKADRSMNHIEEGVLDLVGRLYPDIFSALEKYLMRHVGFVDETIALFDREIQFVLAYLEYIDPLTRAGLSFCYPEVSASEKTIFAQQSFDLALAAKLVGEEKSIVCNEFHLGGPERMIVVSGPNQGGKTTFARMFGQLHFLAGLGCPVPGKQARLFLADQVFTHFEREEDITNLRGKLEDELVRIHETRLVMTNDSIVILNEIFNSTSLQDQIFLSRKVLEQLLEMDALAVCVTFIDELASLSVKTVSMVSTVVPDNPAVRTFEIVRKPADGLAYALSLAEKRNVTYERLRKRIRQ